MAEFMCECEGADLVAQKEVDLTSDEDPTDVDIGLGDSTGVLAPLDDEISLGEKNTFGNHNIVDEKMFPGELGNSQNVLLEKDKRSVINIEIRWDRQLKMDWERRHGLDDTVVILVRDRYPHGKGRLYKNYSEMKEPDNLYHALINQGNVSMKIKVDSRTATSRNLSKICRVLEILLDFRIFGFKIYEFDEEFGIILQYTSLGHA
ncbi:hypothetical protein Tco_0506442 [Tanacetum coccineum]